MQTYQGLFWEHWNQSRLWIIGAASLLILMTVSVWLNHDWVMREYRNEPFELDKFAWMVGFTGVALMFVNHRVREVNLYFPRRQFALPCRTIPLILSHLLFKTAVATGLGLLIALYHRVLQEEPFSLLPVYLFVALVAVAQAVALLASYAGAWTAGAVGGLVVLAAMLAFLALDSLRPLDPAAALWWPCAVLVSLGWAGSLLLAPLARSGSNVRLVWPRNRPISASHRVSRMPVSIVWRFNDPVWAQAWHEWRRVVCWMPRVAAPASLLCVALMLTDEGAYAVMTLVSIIAIPALFCSYFLYRLSPTESSFLLARPGAVEALVDGKLLAALAGTMVTVALAVAAVAIGTLVLHFRSEVPVGLGNQSFWTLYPLMATVTLWLALSSTPVIFVGMGLWFIFGILVLAPFIALDAYSPPLAWGYSLLATMVAAICFFRLQRRDLPLPWELGIVVLVFLPNSLAWWINGDSLILAGFFIPQSLQFAFLTPLLLLWAGLTFSVRIGVMALRRAVHVALAHALVYVLLTAYVYKMDATPEVFLWATACFAPVIWIPLALRLQRYR